jgi:hypothetical protein
LRGERLEVFAILCCDLCAITVPPFLVRDSIFDSRNSRGVEETRREGRWRKGEKKGKRRTGDALILKQDLVLVNGTASQYPLLLFLLPLLPRRSGGGGFAVRVAVGLHDLLDGRGRDDDGRGGASGGGRMVCG